LDELRAGRGGVTYGATHCLVCEAPGLMFRAAITSPFVARRALERSAALCRIAQCAHCGFVFFEDRFEDAELARLYADYRGEAYYRARHACEPWYTRQFNAQLGGAEEMRRRRATYVSMVGAHCDAGAIDSVLDYGGDRGQIMPSGPGRRHFVFDISGVAPDPGIIGLDAASLCRQQFDLVLLCEVLEHVSAPAATLADAARHVRPGGLMYVTVPNREFPFSDIPAGAWYGFYLRQILKFRYLTLLADFWSTGWRVKFKRVPPLGFVKLHEHVSFFDRDSLAGLFRRAGLSILGCEVSPDKGGIAALCRKQGSVLF
jgi:SAM-dependent methyltransferase